MLVAFNAHSKVNCIFALAIRTVPQLVFFAPPAREKFGVNDVVAALTINPASTWAATPQIRFGVPYDLIPADLRLSNKVPKVGVSFIADYWAFRELVRRSGVNLQMIPCGADDLVQIWKGSIVRDN